MPAQKYGRASSTLTMATVSDWLSAARLRTLPLALACISMGGILAYHFGQFDPLLFTLILLTATALQVLSNFANDYGDSLSGVDGAGRQGPQRATQSGVISAGSMYRAMIIMASTSLISGLALIYLSPLSGTVKIAFLLVGVACIWAAIRYTAGDRPYGYRALGDVSVFIFFGLVSVLGTYLISGGDFYPMLMLPAMSCGAFSMAVLHINNVRDMDSDRTAGKTSLAILLGRDQSIIYHGMILTIGILAAVIFTYYHLSSPWQWLYLIVTPLLISNWYQLSQRTNPAAIDPLLKQMALTTLLFVVLFGVGLSL